MPIKFKKIACNYVGSFKVGDNLVYNADLLCDLTKHNRDGRFNKSILIQAVSIIEASLAEIVFRAQNYNREGVPNVSEQNRQKIAEKQIDKFAVVIDVMRKYDILNKMWNTIYDDLHKLRRYRNKVHIQSEVEIEGVSLDEISIFSESITNWSLMMTFKVVSFLSVNLARPPQLKGCVNPLRLPKI